MTEKKTVTYVDSCVLIAEAQGTSEVHDEAMAILDDPDRLFAASEFLRLEVLPKPVFNRKTAEAEFYTAYFEKVSKWADDFGTVVMESYSHAVRNGLSAMDALHVASAIATETDELITAEGPHKPLSRVTAVRVTTIRR